MADRTCRSNLADCLTAGGLIAFVLPLALGAPLADAIGGAADYVAEATLIALGGWMLLSDEEVEERAVGRLAAASGWALVGLGLGISLDELAIGSRSAWSNCPRFQ